MSEPRVSGNYKQKAVGFSEKSPEDVNFQLFPAVIAVPLIYQVLYQMFQDTKHLFREKMLDTLFSPSENEPILELDRTPIDFSVRSSSGLTFTLSHFTLA